MFRKTTHFILIVVFVLSSLGLPPKADAQTLLDLPQPGSMVQLSAPYQPALLKGLTIHPDDPFQFDFIVDIGQDKLKGDILKAEGEKQIKYFLASLAIPEKDWWVNLSPYEKDKTAPEALSQTDLGRDLLAQDYILKQITASLIYPEKELGKVFWDKVYTKAREMYGNVNIPVNTFNKVWITSDQAEVFERGQTAIVTKSHLKVMLEQDYLATHKNAARDAYSQTVSPSRHPSPRGVAGDEAIVPLTAQVKQSASQASAGNSSAAEPAPASQVIREVILPELEREVNTGKNFANLRQIYQALILASWYKKNLKEALLNQTYADKSTVKGIDLEDKTVKEQIYNRYLQAYKKGVFNFVKEESVSGRVEPRKYFSGGMDAGMAANPAVTKDQTRLSFTGEGLVRINVGTELNARKDRAMNVAQLENDIAQVIAAASGDFHKGDVFRQRMSQEIVDIITDGLVRVSAHRLILYRIVSARRDVAESLQEEDVQKALSVNLEAKITDPEIAEKTSHTLVGMNSSYRELFKKIEKRRKFDSRKVFSKQYDIGTSGMKYEQRIEMIPWLDGRVFYEVATVPNYAKQAVLLELERLWKIIFNAASDQERYDALARYEWWIIQANFYSRAGASIGDAMSIVAQLANKMPLRKTFEHIDFDVLSMTLEEYVQARVAVLQKDAMAALFEVNAKGGTKDGKGVELDEAMVVRDEVDIGSRGKSRKFLRTHVLEAIHRMSLRMSSFQPTKAMRYVGFSEQAREKEVFFAYYRNEEIGPIVEALFDQIDPQQKDHWGLEIQPLHTADPRLQKVVLIQQGVNLYDQRIREEIVTFLKSLELEVAAMPSTSVQPQGNSIKGSISVTASSQLIGGGIRMIYELEGRKDPRIKQLEYLIRNSFLRTIVFKEGKTQQDIIGEVRTRLKDLASEEVIERLAGQLFLLIFKSSLTEQERTEIRSYARGVQFIEVRNDKKLMADVVLEVLDAREQDGDRAMLTRIEKARRLIDTPTFNRSSVNVHEIDLIIKKAKEGFLFSFSAWHSALGDAVTFSDYKYTTKDPVLIWNAFLFMIRHYPKLASRMLEDLQRQMGVGKSVLESGSASIWLEMDNIKINRIIENWMKGDIRALNFRLFKDRVSAAARGDVVLYYAGDLGSPRALLIAFRDKRDHSKWSIDAIESMQADRKRLGQGVLKRFVVDHQGDVLELLPLRTDDVQNGQEKWEDFLRDIGFRPNGWQFTRDPGPFHDLDGDQAQTAASDLGGIDLQATPDNTLVQKDPALGGVRMVVDQAMIERVKQEGIQSLRPVIFNITPITDIWKAI